jgi:hypothetical protein
MFNPHDICSSCVGVQSDTSALSSGRYTLAAGITGMNPDGPYTYWWALAKVTVWSTETQADDDLRSSQSGAQQMLLGATCNVSDIPADGQQLWQCRAHNVAIV